jgi:hypothetical protein
MDFITNVSASIVGGILLIWGMALVSRQAKELFIMSFAHWLGFDLIYVFKDKLETNPALRAELKAATFAYILTSRGNDFQQDAFSPIFLREKEHLDVRILLPNPYKSTKPDWFEQREIELSKIDASFGHGVLRKQTITNIEYLHNHVREHKIVLGLYSYPLIGRLVITDRCLFFTPMYSGAYIRRSKTFKYSAGGDMYRHYFRLFTQLWSSAEAPPLPALAHEPNPSKTDIQQPQTRVAV